MRGAIISHLPMTSFCWLPPDSDAGRHVGAVGAHREQPHDPLHRVAFGGRVDDAPARQAAERGEGEVVAHRHRQHQALGLAVLGDQRHADLLALRVVRAGDGDGPAVDPHLARRAAQHAEERQQQLALALAVESAEADHLAGAQSQRDVVQPVGPARGGAPRAAARASLGRARGSAPETRRCTRGRSSARRPRCRSSCPPRSSRRCGRCRTPCTRRRARRSRASGARCRPARALPRAAASARA